MYLLKHLPEAILDSGQQTHQAEALDRSTSGVTEPIDFKKQEPDLRELDFGPYQSESQESFQNDENEFDTIGIEPLWRYHEVTTTGHLMANMWNNARFWQFCSACRSSSDGRRGMMVGAIDCQISQTGRCEICANGWQPNAMVPLGHVDFKDAQITSNLYHDGG